MQHHLYRSHLGSLHLTAEPLSAEQAVTFKHACDVFGCLIQRGETIPYSEWVERIERNYCAGPKRAACVEAVRAAGRVRSYWVSVLRPVRDSLCLTLLRCESGEPLAWVREHADELATLHDGPGYVALMVHESEEDWMRSRDACEALHP